jgi:beta-glucanase (GH16 family)
MKMNSLDKIVDIGKYLGDSDKADWVAQGEPVVFNDNVLLTMPKDSVGTLLSSTVYMWYGNVKARIKTSRGAGVVTAFILFSDVKDEIDYEWVGVDLNTVQTNYYFQGITDYGNTGNLTVDDSYNKFHDYEIQWTPDEIRWLVDGKVGRTKKRSETWNATSQQWHFPQTPSRVQISIWPGGLETNAKGTIDWAGGKVDWNSDEIKNYGYYFATFGEIKVECWKTDRAPGTNKGISYYYNDISATNNTVVDSNKPTILKSFLGTGKNMDKPDNTQSGDASESSVIHAIPGGGIVTGSGNTPGVNGNGGGGSNGGSSGAGGSGCRSSDFLQSCSQSSTDGGDSSGNNSNNGVRGADRTLGASAFAVIVGIAGLLFL